MINQEKLNYIGKFLDVEKIQVIPKQSIVCFPKKVDEEFLNKFKIVKEELDKIPFVDIQIIEEGEIDNGLIELSTESNNNGSTG
jgi:DNA-directed RNA polymerase subunit H (RpoH/RPB5)